MDENPVLWQGREWTSKQWRAYQDALKRSQEQWRVADQEIIDRNPLPPIKIGDKYWGDWEPRIIS